MDTTTSLDFRDHKVRIDIEDVSLRPGLSVHEFAFQCKIQADWLGSDDQAYGLLTLEGRISIGPAWSVLAVLPATTLTIRPWAAGEKLTVLLTDDQLLAIEVGGGSNGVEFHLDLTGTLLDIRPRLLPTVQAQSTHRVSGSRWLELLDQVGSALAITVRVPTPMSNAAAEEGTTATPNGPSMTQATKRLREARAALRDGDFEGCITICRRALENLMALQPPMSVEELKQIVPKTRNQHQRWSAIIQDLFSLTSGANHDDEIPVDLPGAEPMLKPPSRPSPAWSHE